MRLWFTRFWWLLANLFSFGLAGAFFHNFPLNYSPSIHVFRTPFELAPAVFGFLFGFVPALLAGWLQRWILRGIWPVSRWWIVSVSFGMGVMHFLADGYVFAGDGTGFVLVGGLIIGLLQWLLLRPHSPSAHWWGLIGAAGWTLGWAAGSVILDAIRYPDDGSGNFTGHVILGMGAALLYSLGTGLFFSPRSGRNSS